MHARSLIAAVLAVGAVTLSGAVLAQSTGMSKDMMDSQSQSSQAPGSMTQSDIRQLQQALNNSGQNVQVDGLWGKQTEAALRNYQQANGLEPTGRPDQATMAALNMDPSIQSGSSGRGTMPPGNGNSDMPQSRDHQMQE